MCLCEWVGECACLHVWGVLAYACMVCVHACMCMVVYNNLSFIWDKHSLPYIVS